MEGGSSRRRVGLPWIHEHTMTCVFHSLLWVTQVIHSRISCCSIAIYLIHSTLTLPCVAIYNDHSYGRYAMLCKQQYGNLAKSSRMTKKKCARLLMIFALSTVCFSPTQPFLPRGSVQQKRTRCTPSKKSQGLARLEEQQQGRRRFLTSRAKCPADEGCI